MKTSINQNLQEISQQLKIARTGLNVLHDIIGLINESLSFQFIILSFQYFVLGIFASFNLFETFLGKQVAPGVMIYAYFTIYNHISLITSCLITFSCQSNVSLKLFWWLPK
jgi:hypothetical protein